MVLIRIWSIMPQVIRRSKISVEDSSWPLFVCRPFCVLVLHNLVQVSKRTSTSKERYLRRPHALQSVLAPSGPRRHSGVSALLQLWHLPGGAARCGYKVSGDKHNMGWYLTPRLGGLLLVSRAAKAFPLASSWKGFWPSCSYPLIGR